MPAILLSQSLCISCPLCLEHSFPLPQIPVQPAPSSHSACGNKSVSSKRTRLFSVSTVTIPSAQDIACCIGALTYLLERGGVQRSEEGIGGGGWGVGGHGAELKFMAVRYLGGSVG